jgi:MobA-like NTP transferase domain
MTCIDRRYRAVVMAGGAAVRMGVCTPKSLLEFEGAPLLSRTLDALSRAEVSPVLVVTNRTDWLAATARCVSRVDGAALCVSRDVASTFIVVQDFARAVADRFLFAYGHAPRPEDHYRALFLSKQAISVSTTLCSSKRKSIPARHGAFVEPPYVLSRQAIVESNAHDWAQFFIAHAPDVEEIATLGPGEFNYPAERHQYDAYLVSLAGR